MVPGLKKLPYDTRLQMLGLWTLEERRNRADLLEVLRCTRDVGLALGLVLGLMPSSDIVLKSTVLLSSCVPILVIL